MLGGGSRCKVGAFDRIGQAFHVTLRRTAPQRRGDQGDVASAGS